MNWFGWTFYSVLKINDINRIHYLYFERKISALKYHEFIIILLQWNILLSLSPFPQKYSTGATTCEDCALGTFSAVDGAASCTPCPAGEVNADEGLSACTACETGMYAPVAGMTECILCYG